MPGNLLFCVLKPSFKENLNKVRGWIGVSGEREKKIEKRSGKR